MICIKNVPSVHQGQKAKLDVIGLILLVLGIGCMQFFLERGEANDWFSSKIITAAIYISTISLGLFILHEKRTKNPIINIFLFQEKSVSCGVLLMGAVGFYLYGVIFILPIFMQNIFGYDATKSGLIFIPGSILTALIMPFVGKNLTKIPDIRILIGVGLIFVEICLHLLSNFSIMSSSYDILIALFMRGIALAFLFVPINSAILSQFSGYEMGQVAGLLNLFRQFGGSIGIALITTFFKRRNDKHYHDLVENISMLNPTLQSEYNSTLHNMSAKMSKSIGFSDYANATAQMLVNRVSEQAFVITFCELALVIGIVFSLSFIALYFLKLERKSIQNQDAH